MIRKLLLAALALLASCVAASAMSQSQLPSYFPIPFANVAGCGTPYTTNCFSAQVPQSSQIGIVNCAASLTDGFPPLTTVQVSQGGCGPFIQDMNGIIKQITQWSQWQGAGGTVQYNSAFSAAIGGYPKGARLQNSSNAACSWTSTADNNLSDPDTGGANWLSNCSGNGIVGTSSGTNVQTVTTNPFVLQVGVTIMFKAGGSNTAELFVNANGTGSIAVYRHSQFGASATVGGEVVGGQMVTLMYDGGEWQCMSCAFATVGEEKVFTGATAPAGWQVEDGSCISQSTYADLYSYYGSADLWGAQATSGGAPACSAGQFHVKFANGRASVASNNQGVRTGPLSNCAAGVGNGCGVQSQAIAAGNLPASTNSTFQRDGTTNMNGMCNENATTCTGIAGNPPLLVYTTGGSLSDNFNVLLPGSSTPLNVVNPNDQNTLAVKL